MLFTPQQLVGGARYSTNVRMGTWNEDLELEQLKLKDYLSQKEHGDLLVNAKSRKLEAALKKTELSKVEEDHTLRFGMKVMIANHKSAGCISVDPFTNIPKEKPTKPVTTSESAMPTGRNTFVIERANPKDGFGESDEVHYGQDLYLRLEPFADMTSAHFLHSEHVTPLAAAKFSRKQEVVMLPGVNGKCLWQMAWPDVKERFEMDACPVKVHAPVCIKHVFTGSFLASDKIVYQNLFGCEFELHCHNYVSTNKTQNLNSERKGQITGDYPLRRQGVENVWSILTE